MQKTITASPNTTSKVFEPLSDQTIPLLLRLLSWTEGDALLDLTSIVPANQKEEFWDNLLQLAVERNVVTRLNFVFKAHAEQLPSALLNRFRAIYFGSLVRNTALAEKGLKIVSVLQAANIPCLVMKGTALTQQLYGDLASRNSLDIDLLVKSEDVMKAAQLLENLGYHFKGWPDHGWKLTDRYDDGWEVTKVEINFDCSDDEADKHYYLVDLHWDLSGTWWLGRLLKMHEWQVFERAYKLPLPEINQEAFVPTLSLEDAFIFLIIHGGVNHLSEELSQFIDLDRFIRVYQDKLDWAFVLSLLQKYRLKLITYCMLKPLIKEMTTPVPEWFLAALRPPLLKKALLKFWPYRPNLQRLVAEENLTEGMHQSIILPLFDGYSLTVRAFWLQLFPGHTWLRTCYAAQTVNLSGWQRWLLRHELLNLAWYQFLHFSRKFKNLRELPR